MGGAARLIPSHFMNDAPLSLRPPVRDVTVGPVTFGAGRPLCVIAGPCVIEEDSLVMETAGRLKEVMTKLGVPWIFKSSYEKDNRAMPTAYTGPGLEKGLELLARVKATYDVPVISDVHRIEDIDAAAKVLDVIQIPAFLCQQTSLVIAAGKSGRCVNVKKGQFLAPETMDSPVAKLAHVGCDRILLTERGSNFGYNRLVNDFTGINVMQGLGWPVVFDATHSVRMYGIRSDDPRGGLPQHVPALARAAVAAGCNGLFIETHPDPPHAKCDASSQFRLDRMGQLLEECLAIGALMRSWGEA